MIIIIMYQPQSEISLVSTMNNECNKFVFYDTLFLKIILLQSLVIINNTTEISD